MGCVVEFSSSTLAIIVVYTKQRLTCLAIAKIKEPV